MIKGLDIEVVIIVFTVHKIRKSWLFIPVRGQCLVGSLTGAVAS